MKQRLVVCVRGKMKAGLFSENQKTFELKFNKRNAMIYDDGPSINKYIS